MPSSNSGIATLLLLVGAARASAQESIREHSPGHGWSVATLSDQDGDEIRDYAMGLDVRTSQERVEVRSGATGALLRTILGTSSPDDFGSSLADAGDVDGDGIHDLLVGARMAKDPAAPRLVQPGAVFVYSGTDGSFVLAVYGTKSIDYLGNTVSGLDDVDGDGHADFLASAYGLSDGLQIGFVRCYSGFDGSLLYQIDGSNAGDVFGRLSPLSDHDGDGIKDFAAGCEGQGTPATRTTRICSGTSGSTIASIDCPTAFSFGSVCELDDLDGDGRPEIAMGEAHDGPDWWDGRVRIFSIATMTELRVHRDEEDFGFFGEELETIADADGDGVRDYLIGAPGFYSTRGHADLHSGRTGERLHRFEDPDADVFMGWSLADLGDVDGDGLGDFVIGSPFSSVLGVYGRAFVHSGNDLWLDAAPKRPQAGALATLATHAAPTGHPVGVFLVDVNGSPTFGLVALGVSDSVEAFTVQDTVPPGLAGLALTFRSYAIGRTGRLVASADETIEFE